MEMSLIILAWVVFSVIQILAERKRQPSSNPPPNFRIPTLANDPTQSAELQEVNLEHLYRQRKSEVKAATPVQTTQPVEEPPPLSIDMNAVILSEILSKPKALRRR